MQLAALLQSIGVPLNAPEAKLIGNLNQNLTKSAQERYEKQLKTIADQRTLIQQMPDQKSVDRQKRAEKAKMLKERLQMLKQMIPFMSASAAKSLKAELRQIAAEISALANSGSKGELTTGNTGLTTIATATSAATESVDSASVQAEADSPEAVEASASEEDSTEPQSETDQKENSNENSDAEDAKNKILEQVANNATENANNRKEKEDLEKLQQLLQSVKSLLERKLKQRNAPAHHASSHMQAYQEAAIMFSQTAVSIQG